MINKTEILEALLAKLSMDHPGISDALLDYISDYPERDRTEILNSILKHGSDTDLNELRTPGTAVDDNWKLCTLKDAYQPIPPIEYIIHGLIAIPSLNILYGAPGDMKSMLAADFLTCVAAGQPWLPPLPDADLVNPFITSQSPVLWVDFDNGKRRTQERLGALSRARQLPDTTPLFYYSMGDPVLNASQKEQVGQLGERIIKQGAKLCVIDNLGIVAGVRDENASEIGSVMSNLRLLVEDLKIALVLIHHQRKSNGQGGRRGDSIRGHSSIEASLDLGLQIERPEESNSLVVRATKVRGNSIQPFGAHFTYEHRPGTDDLETAKFFGVRPADVIPNISNIVGVKNEKPSPVKVKEIILDVIRDTPDIKQGSLLQKVKEEFPGMGNGPIKEQIEDLIQDGKLSKKNVAHGAFAYSPIP
jgi:hypothetical protein